MHLGGKHIFCLFEGCIAKKCAGHLCVPGISDEDVQRLIDATAVPVTKPPPAPKPPSSDGDGAPPDLFEFVDDDAPATARVAKQPLAAWIVQAAGGEAPKQPTRKKGASSIPEPLMSSGVYILYTTGQHKASKGATKQLLPKHLLQLYCTHMQLGTPRFERLPPGGGRGGVRYAVLLDVPRPAHVKGPRAPPQRLGLLPEHDGWDGVQDAQHAAALWALYRRVPEQPLEQVLPEPFAALWKDFEATSVADVRSAEADRDVFLDELLQRRDDGAARPWEGGLDTQQPGGGGGGRGRALGPPINGRAMAKEWAAWKASDKVWDDDMSATNLRVATTLSLYLFSHFLCLTVHSRTIVPQGKAWLKQRAALPIHTIRAALLSALQQHDVVVVMGDTGCGKTTQVPQYLLEDAAEHGSAANVVVTQPRRIAAMSVAERVAEERGEGRAGTPGARVRCRLCVFFNILCGG